jgi:hypothetical protein
VIEFLAAFVLVIVVVMVVMGVFAVAYLMAADAGCEHPFALAAAAMIVLAMAAKVVEKNWRW